jgi:hypothetical protein
LATSSQVCGSTAFQEAVPPMLSGALQPTFQVSKPYTLVPRQELNRLIGGTWDKFHATYPKSGGIRTFSAVGFNNTKTVAVVYYSPEGMYLEEAAQSCYFRGWTENGRNRR